MTGGYKGRPMEVHARLPEISDALFLRWLQFDALPNSAAEAFFFSSIGRSASPIP